MQVLFITSNEGKFREIKSMGESYGIDIEWHQEEYLEPQGSDLKEIARASAESLTEKLSKPFIIEDSGLFIEGLKGFPGPYSSYVYKTIGNEGISKLVKDIDDRDAYFLAVVAYFDGEYIHTFEGRVDGEVTPHIRGKKGFGFDPVFLYGERTFAEMDGEEKNQVSHRRKAFEDFFTWLGNSKS